VEEMRNVEDKIEIRDRKEMKECGNTPKEIDGHK
jgi:hypothetical protein